MLQTCNDPEHPQKGDDDDGLIVAVDEDGRAYVPAAERARLLELCRAQQDEIERLNALIPSTATKGDL